MKRRPCTVERRAPDPAAAKRRRAAEAVIRGRVSEALAPILADVRDHRMVGVAAIDVGRGIFAGATDGAGAASALGVVARRAEAFAPATRPDTLALATFGEGQR